MDVKVFKSLYKPLTWGGIPRVSFISIVVVTILIATFHLNFNTVLVPLFLYGVIWKITKLDPKYPRIIYENSKYKDVYLPD